MIIGAPDGKSINFPDTMSKEDVTSAMQKLYPPKAKEPEVSSGMDMAKGLGSGLVSGALAPFDMAADAGNYLGNKAADLFTDKPNPSQSLPEPSEMMGGGYKPQTTLGKVSKVTGEVAGAIPSIGGPALKGGKAVLTKGADYINEHFPKSVIPNADELKAIGSGLYKEAAELGGTVKKEVSDKFVETIQNMKPQTRLGQAYGGDSEFTKAVDKISDAMKGQPVSLDEAQELDELLGDEIDKFVENGVPNKQGKKLLDIQSAFRNMISEAPEDQVEGGKEGFEALSKARQVWSASRRAADLEKIITRAEMSTTNPDQAIRSGFSALYRNPARMRGFSLEERAAIKKAAESGVVGDLLGIVGSRLGPIISYASGAGLGADAASAGASIAARGARSAVAVGRAKNAANMVSKNAMNKAGIPLETGPRINIGKYAE